MDTERYQRAKSIFFEACEQSRHDRAAFVERRCADDPPLREAVMELLQHDEDPMTLIGSMNASSLRQHLERLADGTNGKDGKAALDLASPPTPQTAAADYIGRYRILGLLGSGGMGVVHLAEQENPRRRVALKVIRPGHASPAILRRFEHEAHVLGLLQHANIARIYEAGTFDVGDGAQPFFAMELVQGRPLLGYCDQMQADQRVRLELFIKVCEAVEYAHRRGVVHRDLKPANIVVDESVAGGPPQPKVLDFGVARVISGDGAGDGGAISTMHTAAGQLVGTVAYMSPEQLSGDPQHIDARSDVFALGAILFELLSGRLPHDLANKSIPESIRIVSEHEPMTLATINRACRGDLDTIVGKAMERDQSRRYQSAGDLADDVRRYLGDEPILARPPSTMYQFRKFARRNKALVGGVAAVFLALILGIIATLWQARVARANAARAGAEAEKALSVSDFLQRMLSSARPAVSQGRELSVREVLDEAAAELDRTGAELAPEVEGALRVTVARAYLTLEKHEAAQTHLDRALVRLRQAYPGDHESIADCLEAMGRSARERGDWDGAVRITRDALDMITRLHPGDHELKAQALSSLGWLLPQQNDLEGAERCFTEAIAMLSRLRDPRDLDVASLKIDLASISHANPVHNEQLVLEAIKDITEQRGDRHPTLPRALNLLGAYQQIGGRLEEAEASYRRALEIRLAIHGPDNEGVIDSVQLVAWTLSSRGEHTAALALLQEHLPHARVTYRDAPSLLVGYLARIGSAQQALGDTAAAIETFREGVAIFDASGIPSQPLLAKVLSALAMLMASQGEDDQAQQLAERCLNLPPAAGPRGQAPHGEALLALGEVRTRRGEFADAETALLESERIFSSSGPRYQPQRQRAIKSIVGLYEAWNRREAGSRAEEIERWRAMLPAE